MLKFSLLLLLVITFDQYSVAQKVPKMEALNRYQIKDKDTLYQFYAIKPYRKIKYGNDKIYYWYLKDSIIITQAATDGKILHGEFVIYYPDKNLKEQGEFKYGLKDGEWKYWYPGGRLKQIIEWKNGKGEGKIEEYNEQGKKTKWGYSSNDQFTGYMLERSPEGKESKIQYKKGKKVELKSANE